MRLWDWEQCPCPFKEPARLGGGVEARMPDLMEAVGKDVLDEPTQELNRVQGCGLVAFGAEGDVLGAHIQDP